MLAPVQKNPAIQSPVGKVGSLGLMPAQNFPTGQEMQAELSTAAVVGLYFPAGQLTGSTVPAGHIPPPWAVVIGLGIAAP